MGHGVLCNSDLPITNNSPRPTRRGLHRGCGPFQSLQFMRPSASRRCLKVGRSSRNILPVLSLNFGPVARKFRKVTQSFEQKGNFSEELNLMKAEGGNDSFQRCVSSSCPHLSRSEEGSQGRSELFCGSRSSSERSVDPYSSSMLRFSVFPFSSYSSRPRLRLKYQNRIQSGFFGALAPYIP